MKLDSYEVLHSEDGSLFRLSHGQTSSSYKALDVQLRRPVVLKVIRPEFREDEATTERFAREARVAAQLQHPNVAMIHGFGNEHGACFCVREFVEGETLAEKVKRDGPLELTEALEIGLQIARALAAVKKANLVPREIKPSGIMLTPDRHVKIIELGLAQSDPDGRAEDLETDRRMGFADAAEFASPEQLHEEPVEAASGIYSLGATLWYLLTGRPPFRGPMALVMAQHLQKLPPFEDLAALPSSVVSMLAHMLEKDPAKRPPSPSHLVKELERCLASIQCATAAPVSTIQTSPETEAVPRFKKMNAAREPASEHGPPGRLLLAELLIGAAIALNIYFVVTRMIDQPASTAAPVPPESASPRIQEFARKPL